MTLAKRVTLPVVFLLAVAIRAAVFALPIHDVLQARPELSTPLTRWRNLCEGVYVRSQGGDPYQGGVFYHSPIYLVFFSYFSQSTLPTALLWISADCLATVALLKIWHSRNRADNSDRDVIIAAAYLLNPYTIATCGARSTTAIDNAVVLGAVGSACSGYAVSSAALLAVATHLTVYPAALFLPVVVLSNRPKLGAVSFVTMFSLLSTLWIYQHHVAWITSTWGTILSVSDLTPNVGMWWYFFTEMFDHFRPFFLGVFHLHSLIYILPVWLRLKTEPLVVVLVLMGVSSTWKSYPQLGDYAAWAGLLACFPEILSELKHPFFTASVHLYTTILLPLLHSLWLVTGTGNANFFYAATMVYGLNASLGVVDVTGAALRSRLRSKAPLNCEIVQLTTI